MTAPGKLTRNQMLVLEALHDATGALSAYELLDQLKDDGLKAPPQIYRALDKLMETGAVHRLESLNAFVACSHTQCGDAGGMVAFMICDSCERVNEISSQALADALDRTARDQDFVSRTAMVELRGHCSDCAVSPNPGN